MALLATCLNYGHLGVIKLKVLPLTVLSIMLLSPTADAADIERAKFYLEFGAMTRPTEISPSSDLAGAFVGQPYNGAIGDVRSNSNKTGAAIKVGYSISEKYDFEIEYLRSSYKTVDFGVSFYTAGQYDPLNNPLNAYTGSAVLSSKTFFASVVRKFSPLNDLTPYVGFGIGLSKNNFSEGTGVGSGVGPGRDIHSRTKDSIAIKADFGVGYKLSPSVSWQSKFSIYDLGHYISASSRNNGPIDPYKFESGINQSIYTGLRFSF